MFIECNEQRLIAVANENGSIITMVLLILAIMTVIGIMSADTVIKENFILRNAGIYKQNVNLVEAAVMEGLQEVIEIDPSDPANFDPEEVADDWIVSDENDWVNEDWYDADTIGRLLDANNSRAPEYDDDSGILQARGEDGDERLRITLVGWRGEGSLKATQPTPKVGRILAEYVSGGQFGMLRMEVGVERKF